MSKKKTKKQSAKATLTEVTKEMAKPRVAMLGEEMAQSTSADRAIREAKTQQ